MTKIATIQTALIAGAMLAVTTASQGTIIYNSTLTTADGGYVDGAIGFGGVNPDNIIGQGGFALSDTAGIGILNGPTGFQRALFGWASGAPEADETFINGMAVGSTITVTASGLTITADPGANRNLLVLGLSNVDAGNILGASSLARGGHLVANATGDIFAQPDAFGINLGVALDTGKNVGETFDYSVLYTAEGAGLFTVEQKIDGSTVFSQNAQAFDFTKSGTSTTGHLQDFGGTTAYTVDGLFFDVTVIPEPSTLALLGLGLAGILARRRR